MSVERRGAAICNVSNIGEGKDEMTKASIDVQDLRRRLYVKRRLNRPGGSEDLLKNERASAGNDGIGSGCTTLEGCLTLIECDATGRKSPQQDRSHKLWREANGGAQCGKSARCVRRGGGWRRGVGRDPRATPARQPSTLPMSGDGKRSVAEWPKLPRPSSTLPKPLSRVRGHGGCCCAVSTKSDRMTSTSVQLSSATPTGEGAD